MILNSNEIEKIIPHRYPFLLVDRIEILEVGKKAIGIKCVTANEKYFIGHFPKKHIMPGVLIIEAIAQTGAVTILAKEENKGKLIYLAGIKNAKFRRQVVPGDVLKLEIQLLKQKSNVGIGNGVAKVGEEVACECEIIFAIEK